MLKKSAGLISDVKALVLYYVFFFFSLINYNIILWSASPYGLYLIVYKNYMVCKNFKIQKRNRKDNI